MKLEKLLNEFYLNNGVPENGGIAYDTFNVKVWSINIPFPNPKFRKDVTHIHDIEHILNNCDTSSKGEAFIAGWEIGTRFYKYFPINIIIILAFGYFLWLHPKTVFKGFKKGMNTIGIIDLGLTKSELMKMEFNQLVEITKKGQHTKMGISQLAEFIFCIFTSQIIILFPFILIITVLICVFE
tara:strand:+ start:200 stop:748 length:549 start_codon:yes stop_codon:yes gene_type:complete